MGLVATVRGMALYAAMGGVSFVVNMALTALLHEVWEWPEELAFAIALVAVFVLNFLTCRFVVFDGRQGDPRRQLLLYALSSLGFRSAEYLSFLVVHTWLGVPYLVAIPIVLGTWLVGKFFFYRGVVFAAPPSAKADAG